MIGEFKMDNYVYNKLKLTNLLVNTGNPRFESVGSQIEAIENMIRNQSTKLYNLAEDIINNGLNPSDLTIVIKSNYADKMFIVLEGNRRITALKLLHEPDLIPSEYLNLQKKFKELGKGNSLSQLEEINCVVFDNEEDARHWIEIKHTGELEGVGTVRWDTKQQERFKANLTNKSISLQAVEFIEQGDIFDKDIKKDVASIAITNLDRLLSDPDVRNFLGLATKNNILISNFSKKEVVKGLRKIVHDLATKKINVNNIYYKADRLKYLETFRDEEIPQKDIVEVPWVLMDQHELNNQGIEEKELEQREMKEPKSETKHCQVKSKPLSQNRKYLIPKECIIRINDPRINAIYREMKKLAVDDFPNLAATILRIFTELSIDYFINQKKITWVDVDKSLVKKIEAVIQYLQKNNVLNKHELKPARTVLSSNSFSSTETLNAYIHNRLLHPNPKELKITWDNIELFIKTILND